MDKNGGLRFEVFTAVRKMIIFFLVLELLTSSIIQYSEQNTTFQKLDLFLSSGEKVGNTYTVGSIIKE
jgi:hypothetical protein